MKVAAIIIAFNRNELLKRAIQAIQGQSRQVDSILVVDNAKLSSTRKLCLKMQTKYIQGDESWGSAGGFARGISEAIDLGFEYLWLLDDDGYPDRDCLSVLLKALNSEAFDLVSPLSISQEDLEETSNTYWINLCRSTKVKVLIRKEFRTNQVQFYNGVLMRRSVPNSIGLPNIQLFMRGDEMDYYFRCKKNGIRMTLCTRALFFHPSSASEYQMSRQILFSANIPTDPKKRYYQFRNRGFLAREYRLILTSIFDFIRYPIAFIFFNRCDWQGLRKWLKLWWAGFTRKLENNSV